MWWAWKGNAFLPGSTTCSMTPIPVEPIALPNEPILAANASPWALSRSGTSATFITGFTVSVMVVVTL